MQQIQNCLTWYSSPVWFLRKCERTFFLCQCQKMTTELWVTSLSDTPAYNTMNVQTLEYRYISGTKKIKSSLWPKYGKTENNISKIFLWMSFFDHKEASIQVLWKLMNIWWSYSSFKNFNQILKQVLTHGNVSPAY